MEKKRIPREIWIFLVASLICLSIGAVLSIRYNTEVTKIKNVISEGLEGQIDDFRSTDYEYKTFAGENKKILVYDFQLKNPNFYEEILEDTYGTNGISNYKGISNMLFFIGAILLIIFVVRWIKYIEGEEFVKVLKIPTLGFILGCFMCIWGISLLGSSKEAVEISIKHRDGDPRLNGLLVLGVGIVIVYKTVRLIHKAISRYRLAKYNPEEYKKLLEQERAEETKRELLNQIMLDRERDEAINGTSGAPWEKHYLPYPCPYCNRYKVRYIKWKDKRTSIYFWGRLSTKIGANYICDNCKRTWE